MLETLARRVDKFGWHIQILMTGAQIAEYENVIRALPNRVVIDHLGRMPNRKVWRILVSPLYIV